MYFWLHYCPFLNCFEKYNCSCVGSLYRPIYVILLRPLLIRVHYPKYAGGPFCNFIRLQNDVASNVLSMSPLYFSNSFSVTVLNALSVPSKIVQNVQSVLNVNNPLWKIWKPIHSCHIKEKYYVVKWRHVDGCRYNDMLMVVVITRYYTLITSYYLVITTYYLVIKTYSICRDNNILSRYNDMRWMSL